MTARIELPFPPAALSGHNTGHWRVKSALVKKHREWSYAVTLSARPKIAETGDILLVMHFHPKDNRGDRTNFANRMKPYIDGIADALGVNDRRFLPSYHFYAPDKNNPRVEVEIK